MNGRSFPETGSSQRGSEARRLAWAAVLAALLAPLARAADPVITQSDFACRAGQVEVALEATDADADLAFLSISILKFGDASCAGPTEDSFGFTKDVQCASGTAEASFEFPFECEPGKFYKAFFGATDSEGGVVGESSLCCECQPGGGEPSAAGAPSGDPLGAQASGATPDGAPSGASGAGGSSTAATPPPAAGQQAAAVPALPPAALAVLVAGFLVAGLVLARRSGAG